MIKSLLLALILTIPVVAQVPKPNPCDSANLARASAEANLAAERAKGEVLTAHVEVLQRQLAKQTADSAAQIGDERNKSAASADSLNGRIADLEAIINERNRVMALLIIERDTLIAQRAGALKGRARAKRWAWALAIATGIAVAVGASR